MVNKNPTLPVVVAAVIGVALLAAGILDDGRIDCSDMRSLGAVVILVSLAWAFLRVIRRPTDVAYCLGHADGYADGFDDGRRSNRPVLVAIKPDETARGARSRRCPDPVPVGRE